MKIGEEFDIEVYVGEGSILSYYNQLKYDKEILQMEEVEKSVKTIENWEVTEGTENEQGIEVSVSANDSEYVASNTLLMTIHFKVVNVKESMTDIYFNNIYLTDTNYDDSLDEEGYGITEKITLGLEKEEEKDPPLQPVEPDVPSEKPEETTESELYLSSEKYKIGNNDIKNYEKGDEYISRVEKETTKEEYINNLETNGTIRIIKADGTELEDNQLIGTGMTIEITKDEDKIVLKIAVMGDLSGDGKVTPTDLSTLNQTILEMVTLENEYKIAGDLDENENITPTDLSTLNKMVLKIQ